MRYSFLFITLVLIGCSSGTTPVDSAVEGKVLHYGNGTEPQGLDPHIVTGVP